MVTKLSSDIFDAPINVILQCNNCFNTQGSGVARAIRDKWPEVYEEDCKSVKGDRKKLGTCFVTDIEKVDGTIRQVVGLYAQYTFGTDKRQVNYEALYRCLEWVRDNVDPINVIGIPWKMCCNLAGGDWNVVETMIYSVFEDSPFQVLICHRPGDV